MKKTERRQLTPKELKLEKDQKKTRTDYERRAYRWLPDGMRQSVQRNPGVAFKGYSAYYPDLFFPEQKLCIEIDGSVHLCQQNYDKKRERIFKSHGYEVVHIKNADTMEELAFLDALHYELRKIEGIENRILVKDFIDELYRLIYVKKEDMLAIDDANDNYTTDNFELPMLCHPFMQRRLHNGNSLEI